MPDMYCLEIDGLALSCRVGAEGKRVRGYVRVSEEDALQAILGLLKQGLDVGPILDFISEDSAYEYFRQGTW